MEDQWKTGIEEKVLRLETKVDRLQDAFITINKDNAVAEVHRENVDKRLLSIEDTLKWLVRLIIGAIVIGLLGFVTGGLV